MVRIQNEVRATVLAKLGEPKVKAKKVAEKAAEKTTKVGVVRKIKNITKK